MASSLPNFVNNLSKEIIELNVNSNSMIKKINNQIKFIYGIKYKYCNRFLEHTNFKDGLIEYKYLVCNKNCHAKFDKNFKKLFFNTYNFSNYDNNKIILSLQKGVYLVNI